jgi:hypothetical protein
MEGLGERDGRAEARMVSLAFTVGVAFGPLGVAATV